jgi:PAS domain S-box-containing protein
MLASRWVPTTGSGPARIKGVRVVHAKTPPGPRERRTRAQQIRPSTFLRYGVATLAISLVVLLKQLLDPLIAQQSPFLLLSAAVMVAAWFGGLGPGLLATALGAVAADYLFLPPVGSFTPLNVAFLPLLLFVLQGALISVLVEALRSARRGAESRTLEAQRRQEDLRQSEERFRLLVEGVRDYAIFMLDPEGRVATWNEGAQRTMGYEAAEITGEHLSVFYTEEDVERGNPESELRIAATEGRYEKESLQVCKDGSRFWAHVATTALRDEEGDLRGFSKVVRDITERKRAEEALDASETRYRTLVEQMPAITYIEAVDREKRKTDLLYVSPQIADMFGYSPQEWMADPQLFEKLLHPDDRERVLAEDARTDETGEPFSAEYRQFTRDGRVIWVSDEAVLVEDEEGQPLFWQGVMHDVTDQKRAEGALRQSEELYRSVVEQATENVFLVDIETKRILEANAAFHASLGYAPEELEETTLYDVVAHDRETIDQNIERIVAEGRHFVGERRYCRKDGTLMDVEVSVSTVPYGGREVMCIVAHDVTERKRAGEALRFLSEASAELSSSLDYRATLAGMARLAVPALADWCAVDVLEEDGSTHRLAVEHEDPAKVAWAYALELRYPPDPSTPQGVPQVLRTGRSELYPEIPDEMLAAAARDPEHLRLMREIGFTSAMIVPLVARGRTLGAITLVSAESGRRYEEADLELAEELARRAALAVDNAQLYDEAQKEIAERKHAEENLRQSLSAVLALREAGQVLGSTLESGEIVSRLLEIMRSVSNLTAAVISLQDEVGEVPVWRSAGLEGLWSRARFLPEAEAARRATLETGERRLFRLRNPELGSEHLVGLCLPLRSKERILGVLEAYGQESLAESAAVDILGSLASQAGSALENALLYEELEQREQMLQDLVGKLLSAQEEEHRRVAYEVHDGLAQVAAAAHQHLQAFAERYSPEAEKGRRDLDRILRLVRATVTDARRVIANLRPTSLDDLGLAPALSLEVESLRDEGYQVDYEEELGDERLPAAAEIALFRVAQEALNNVRKHAQTSQVRIELRRRDDEVLLEVLDYGRGFDPTAPSVESGPGARVGLAGMRERINVLGGSLEIRSQPDAGTSVVATIDVTHVPHLPLA